MNPDELAAAVLEFVERPEYRPLKPRQIAKRLKVDKEELQDFKRVVKRLVKQGKLNYGVNHLIMKPGSTAGSGSTTGHGMQVAGTFRRNERGHGYVRQRPAPSTGEAPKDIYVPRKQSGDASTGDTVLVQIYEQSGKRGMPQGAIAEILERHRDSFVGTYFELGGSGWVRVDGTIFSQPVSVGDPGAKGARPDDKVVIEMVRYPSHTHDGEAVVVEVLGARGQPKVDTLSIIHEFNLPTEFPPEVLEDAHQQAEVFDESVEGRLDLTGETIITIDPVDARDFDDAISLVRQEDGHWKLGVHIADVSHFVRERSPLDREARNRATSVYLPDRVIPMLPEVISNALASLQPDRVRYTKTVFIEMTDEGLRVSVEVHNSAIRSQRRFTYEEVDEYLDDRESWRDKLTPQVWELLGNMHQLAMKLRARRRTRGALELHLPDIQLELDKDGRVCGAHPTVNTESHQIIEEFMLAANEAVAELLDGKGWSFLRRVHPSPDPRKLKALNEFVSALGHQRPSLESRFELQKLIDEVRDQPEQAAVNYAVLRSMAQAVYSPEVEGHYALAVDNYCHFTSPIRRYPDLTVHRLIDAHLARKQPKLKHADLIALGDHCSNQERKAESAERELTKVKLLTFLSTRIGEQMHGVIVGVEQFGLFVQGVEFPAEGLVHISSLSDDYYHFDRRTHSLAGHRQGNLFRLGDPVTVEIVNVDVDRRELDFRLLGRGHRETTAPSRPQRSSGKSSKRPGTRKPAAGGKRNRKKRKR